jgi:hypothetical protein
VNIAPEETRLVGGWEFVGGAVSPDSVTKRIIQLTSDYLTKIATNENGWKTLYRDPGDARLWELTFPQSNFHGGGPPMLLQIGTGEARSRYRF